MLTAYQEDLLSLEQLRERMPALRQREQTLRTELQAIADQTRERAAYLRLAETLSAFLARLRVAADTLDILERQRIVRLVVKEVLVGDDTIVIRHCIPVPSGTAGREQSAALRAAPTIADVDRSYLLRTGRGLAVAGEHLHASVHQSVPAVRLGPSVRRGAGQLRRRLRHSLSPRGGRGAGDDSAVDDAASGSR